MHFRSSITRGSRTSSSAPCIIAIGLAVALLWLFGHIGTTGVPPQAPGEPDERRSTGTPEIALGLGGAAWPAISSRSGVLRRRFGCGPPPARGRVAAFLAGTGILAGAVLGPLAEWGGARRALAHMLQHLVLILVVPLLWLHGLPPWLLAPVARGASSGGSAGGSPGRVSRPRARVLGSRSPGTSRRRSTPRSAWSGSTPSSTSRSSPRAPALVAGCRVRAEWPRLSPPGQLLYLFLATIPMMAIAAPITPRRGRALPVLRRAPAPRGRSRRGRTRSCAGHPHVGGRDARLPGRGHRGVLPVAGPEARDDGLAPLAGCGGDGAWRLRAASFARASSPA